MKGKWKGKEVDRAMYFPIHDVIIVEVTKRLYLRNIFYKEAMMNMEKYKIIHLPKEQWKNTVIPMSYTTHEYYDVKMEHVEKGYQINIEKTKCSFPISHYPEEYDFPDKLYQDFWQKAFAWGIVEEKDGKQELLACIETCPEEWSNRLIVTELWVKENIRRTGIGHALMAVAKEQARLEHRRAIILETQSCNVPAIGFYRHEGFELIGFDSCCYSNNDIERKEVRINLGYFLRKEKLSKEHIIIRREKEKEYHKVEQMVLQAFWNKYRVGCNEHLLVHKLRNDEVYVPQLSRIAEVNGEIAGAIFYARAKLLNDNKKKDILIFGPLCVAPQWQGCGVGGKLLEETLRLAKQEGFEGVIIFGEPDYYPLHGFQTCDKFRITTMEGKNFDGFMGIELVDGGLGDFGGKFWEPPVFRDLSEEENAEFTKNFKAPEKQKFPCQWD